MKLAKYIVFIVVLIASVVFIIQLDDLNISNDGEPIKIQIPWITGEYGYKMFENGMDVWQAMIFSLSLGVFIGFIIALVQIISQKAELISLKSDNRKLQTEIDNLRNQSLDDEIELTDEVEKIDDISLNNNIKGENTSDDL
tara:strand:- start:162 stop:584 length:423 start_codon:yes stop_codon:yes gene_type:complete